LLPISGEERVYPHGKAKEDEGEEGDSGEYKFGTNWLQKVMGDKQVSFFVLYLMVCQGLLESW